MDKIAKLKLLARLASRGRKLGRSAMQQIEGITHKNLKSTKYLKESHRRAVAAARKSQVRAPEAPQTLREGAGQLLRRPVRTMRKGYKAMGTGETAMIAGFTGLGAPDAVRKDNPNRGRSIGELAGGTAGWLATRRMPFVGSMLGYMAAERLGESAGSVFDKKKKKG